MTPGALNRARPGRHRDDARADERDRRRSGTSALRGEADRRRPSPRARRPSRLPPPSTKVNVRPRSPREQLGTERPVNRAAVARPVQVEAGVARDPLHGIRLRRRVRCRPAGRCAGTARRRSCSAPRTRPTCRRATARSAWRCRTAQCTTSSRPGSGESPDRQADADQHGLLVPDVVSRRCACRCDRTAARCRRRGRASARPPATGDNVDAGLAGVQRAARPCRRRRCGTRSICRRARSAARRSGPDASRRRVRPNRRCA